MALLGAEFATKLDRGNLGLWLTHERLLETCKNSNVHIHILEDDALLPKDAVGRFEMMLQDADKNFPDWDVIFTEVFIQMDVTLFYVLAKAKELYRQNGQIQLSSLKPAPFAGTSSLFINRKSIGKYAKLISGQWKVGLPIDLFLRSLIQKGLLNAYVTLPFLTSLTEHTAESNIQGQLNLSHLVMNIYRRAAFKDADLQSLREELNRLSVHRKHPDFTALYLDVLSFFLSDQQVIF